MNATSHTIKEMSSADFQNLGIGVVAYVKPAVVQGVDCFAIFGADGKPIGQAPTKDAAMAAVKQHDMEPFQIH